ncbi:uncharacterized protein Z518_01608 [Rhinocladiella mackenziei CBS 650.93]|uniref:Rhinocladiella mackenziei CBS 650.93 unplaced genomic scaffold supercont1.1, whole genome shotgun sequence n=1 Tax=Rhinocladiella mackenziei CBS 650.93 TaxID=1442369 RepID=A0A0D2JM65_9EURO|nr:uncharacterized protein Z518_01608 [Rhinocladiella mackenziei CBS 650.93]KIX10525.1 hypothetical protein Z518_01608 [Rhinocladiella mackenziei CBS 650.93]
MATMTATTTANMQTKTSRVEKAEKSIVGDFSWSDVLVPEKAGTGLTKWHYQRRTLVQYACLFIMGLTSFYKLQSPALRAAGLGFLFPGAGLTAVCTIPSILSFIVSTALIPFVLFAWFGMGGVVFPILLWTGTAVLSAVLAKDSVLELAAPLWSAICIGGIIYITYSTHRANAEARRKRESRNNYLIDEVRNNQAQAVQPEPGSREVDEKNLRFLQWFLELGLTPRDDFSYHDVIDQFQTSAIRYQLYETVSDLGLYQNVYCPNFHGYLSQAQRNVIEKSFTKKVMEFWKWESMAGKFNAHDWDPIKKDNIMVTGYILQAVGIYQSNTGDERYTKPGSMTFEITDSIKFPYDLKGVADAVYRNMNEAAYCLYPCEPNWLYTPCNLVGIGGILLTDRLLGNNYGEQLRERFEHALETEFTDPDGSILPIRSELTGFTIPGLAGALSDGVNSILCAAYLPAIAHRNWAFTKKETLHYNEKGQLEVRNLMGADKLDPGNYKAGEGVIRCICAAAAAEFGDEKICAELLRQLDEEFHPVFRTRTGSLKNKGVSTLEQGTTTRARIGKFQDWTKMIQRGPPAHIFRAPVLEEVPFPDVLVAKAYSMDGESVDLVLYNGREPGVFKLGFIRCKPGERYTLMGQEQVVAKDGTVSFEIEIDGRTAGRLKPVQWN